MKADGNQRAAPGCRRYPVRAEGVAPPGSTWPLPYCGQHGSDLGTQT
ncbi:unnamed protein product [Staurois parvus]|uniref:Uncharacterized protein n=1 Tax=Staurois parvus TaxID=386267 RepID=A0ABN9H4Z4_9NEOB|nr:unnamed protein product [Staurois parvus]